MVEKKEKEKRGKVEVEGSYLFGFICIGSVRASLVISRKDKDFCRSFFFSFHPYSLSSYRNVPKIT